MVVQCTGGGTPYQVQFCFWLDSTVGAHSHDDDQCPCRAIRGVCLSGFSMAAKRGVAANDSHAAVSLVPATLSSRLGILNVSALQFLLSSPSNSSTQQRVWIADGDGRPASSELARAYGVHGSDTVAPRHGSPQRRKLVKTKPRRRPILPLKLAPMTTHNPHRHQQEDHAHNAPKTRQFDAHAAKQNGGRAIKTTVEVDARNPVAAHPHVTDTGGNDDKLQQEIQWIYTHVPVRRLANAKCSLALRRRVFTETLYTNLSRCALRNALSQWRWCISMQKQTEATKLRAFNRLVELFANAMRGHVAHCFTHWTVVLEESRELERDAAAISIQSWLVWCRQRRAARDTRTAIRVAQVMAIAAHKAAQIQRVYRVYVATQHLHKSLAAVATIQRFACHIRRRRLYASQREAAQQMEIVIAQTQREQRVHLLLARTRATQANKIVLFWRQYATWRAQLVMEYVRDLVDQVEFVAAVRSIQRHLRGYQCRFRLQRKCASAVCIQRAWRYYGRRQRGRQQRKMMALTHSMAASCLQRAFQRYRERRKHRLAMHKSTRPMFLRALTQNASFRVRFHIPIVKSATSVIQSAWRRHVKYEKWKQRRIHATRVIQRWQRRVRVLCKWQRVEREIVARSRLRRQEAAARKIQRWLRACCVVQRDWKQASMARHLLEMLTSVMTIQRYYRRKHDRWRRLVRVVLMEQLPRWRRAATRISRCWRQYTEQKHRVLERLQGLPSQSGKFGVCGGGARNLSELQELLKIQQRVLERQNEAACVIQRACRRARDKRNGKLLLKRYKMLFQTELRRKQQRLVIHGFLEEKQIERNKRKPATTMPLPSSSSPSFAEPASPSLSSSRSAGASASSATATTTTMPPQSSSSISVPHGTQQASSGTASEASAECDGDHVVQLCWSDEFQCHYKFNSLTGESTWC